MTLTLHRIDDPRDALAKATRGELVKFAKANGLYPEVVNGDMPAILIRKRLRERGLTRIKIPDRPLGQPVRPVAMGDGGAVETPNAVEADAEADLERQWAQQAVKPAEKPAITVPTMKDLRAACKARGIKVERTDNMESLRAKLHGQDAA